MKYSKTDARTWIIQATSNWDVAMLDLLMRADCIQEYEHERPDNTQLIVKADEDIHAIIEAFADELQTEAEYWRSHYTTYGGRPRPGVEDLI